MQYGSDAYNTTVRYANGEFFLEGANLVLGSNQSLRFLDTSGAQQSGVSLSSADDWTFGSSNGANFSNFASGSGGVYAVVAGSTIAQFYSGGLRPQTDNTLTLGTASQRWVDTYSGRFRPGAGGPIWTSGTGTPEGAVTAPVGSMFTRTDGGAGATLYVKESGAGNTGWVAK